MHKKRIKIYKTATKKTDIFRLWRAHPHYNKFHFWGKKYKQLNIEYTHLNPGWSHPHSSHPSYHWALLLLTFMVRNLLLQQFDTAPLNIQLSNYPTIQLMSYPIIQLFNYSTIQLSNYSSIQPFNYKTINQFNYQTINYISTIKLSNHQTIKLFTNQLFDYSTIQPSFNAGLETASADTASVEASSLADRLARVDIAPVESISQRQVE